MTSKTLDRLHPGEEGTVEAISGPLPLRRHLMDLGLTPRTKIHVEKTAPGGDPMEISLRGYSLFLRRSDAQCITIREAGPCRRS